MFDAIYSRWVAVRDAIKNHQQTLQATQPELKLQFQNYYESDFKKIRYAFFDAINETVKN